MGVTAVREALHVQVRRNGAGTQVNAHKWPGTKHTTHDFASREAKFVSREIIPISRDVRCV